MSFVASTVFTAIDKFTAPIKKMEQATSDFATKAEMGFAKAERRLNKLGSASLNFANKSGAIGLAIVAPLVVAGKAAVEFEDKMADVAKTTGLKGKGLQAFSDELLNLSTNTRTSIDDLMKIGEIGGQLGIAEKDLMSFVASSNKFNIALGADFSGGVEQAVTEVGKIRTLFAQTSNLSVSDAIMKTGSAINVLGAEGAGTSSNITDFALRMGALPNALKPSLTNTLALGTLFEELGLTAEIAAGGVTKFLLEAGQNIGGFASQMNMTSAAAKQLLKNDPTKFATIFAKTFEGVAPEVLAVKLKKLGLNSQEVIKVVGALGGNLKRLTELQGFANTAFSDGTSLALEAATKEDTVAAKIEKMNNNFKAFSIIIGTEILPIIGDLIAQIMPVIKSLNSWVKGNRDTLASIVKVVAVLGGLALAISAVSYTIFAFTKLIYAVRAAQFLYNVVLGVATALQHKSALALVGNTVAYKAYLVMLKLAPIATKAMTAAQWLLNAAMSANPLGASVLALIAFIALVVIIIKKFNEWGAALTLFLGPIGLVISTFMAFRRNWDLVKQSFQTGGILSGLKAIGITLIDALLMPIQQLLELIGKLPDWLGGGLAVNAAGKLGELRASLQTSLEQNAGQKPVVNSNTTANSVIMQTINRNQSQTLDVNFNNTPSGTSVQSSGDNIIRPKIMPTFQFQ